MTRFLPGVCLFLLALMVSRLLAGQQLPDPKLLEAMKWREVGPYRGGRSAAVAGLPGSQETYYFGACGGGVWKTRDGGQHWKNVSDGFFGGSIGSVAVSSWDENVVYAGTGEVTVRGNVSEGDGMWKSTDAGRSWHHAGLLDSRHICRVRIHPRNPDLVYAAVLGHLFGPSKERGVYRSKDGGRSWQRVLFVNADTGCVDLAMDPANARILYACFWRVRRTPWSLISGGEGSGIYKSTDGGDHWEEISGHKGLPKAPLGISGIAVSPSNPDNVYAIIEAKEGGVYRSKDAGKSWKRVNSERKLRQRAWYYSRIYADPAGEEALYVVNVRFFRSRDGGQSFQALPTPHGDNHDLWIDPKDPRRMIEANDGGANVSFDGGQSWSPQDNQPTAQIYRVSTDTAFPYRLLGGQQDNSALRIHSRSLLRGSIGPRDFEPTAGGESGFIVASPLDPDLVYGGSYGGSLSSFNHRTGERRSLNPWPDNPMGWGAARLTYRFQWNFPIFFSPNDPHTLYCAANVLFRSVDGGVAWEPISPDLTRDDKSKEGPSGGPITKDNTSVEYYCTIFAACESPLRPQVLWTGSDDGLVHLSQDGGNTWRDVTPKELPKWTLINSLEPDPFQEDGLYLAATRYKLDDNRPMLFKTKDYGHTWQRIDKGIPENDFTRVIRADPDRRGLLFAGTERGVFVSFDDGESWQSLQQGLPLVSITDLAVKHQDLVAATQGRGFWILDDLSFLHQMGEAAGRSPARLYAPRPCYRLEARRSLHPNGRGTNPPSGLVLHYWLEAKPDRKAPFKLEILDSGGNLIRSFSRKPEKKKSKEGSDRFVQDDRLLPAALGLNQFVWDLRYDRAESFKGMILWSGGLQGPRVLPGIYRCRLTVGDWSAAVDAEILADPRSGASAEDRKAQLAFLLKVRAELTACHREIRTIRAVRKQVKRVTRLMQGRPGMEKLLQAAKRLEEQMGAVEEALYQTQNKSSQDPLNFPVRLTDKLAGLNSLVGRGDFAPSPQVQAVRQVLHAAIQKQREKIRKVWEEDLPAFNHLAARLGWPTLVLQKDTKQPSK